MTGLFSLSCYLDAEARGAALLKLVRTRYERYFDVQSHLPVQIANATNRLSAAAALNYIARTHEPAVIVPAVAWFNSKMVLALSHVAGVSTNSSFPAHAIRQSKLPVSLGGLHLRDYSRIGHAAFYGAAVRALKRMPEAVLTAFESARASGGDVSVYCTALEGVAHSITALDRKSVV